MVKDGDALAAVEAAMVAIRRRQNRRAIARTSSGVEVAERGALFGVLDLIEEAQQAGRAIALGEIAEGLGIDQPRASKLVADAVRRGLVRRHADQRDGRRTLLRSTGAGAEVVAHAHHARRSAFAAAMADWSATDRDQFAVLVTRFVADLNRPSPPAADH